MAEARPEAGIHWELHKKLQEAVQEGAATKVKSLLKGFSKDEAREILNYWSSRKTVPLIVLAIRSRHEKVVRFLVNDYDVRVDRITLVEDAKHLTEAECIPIRESILVSSPEILIILLKKVQNVNSGYPVHSVCKRRTLEATKILILLLRNGADVNIKDKRGLTPLILACQYRQFDMVRILLQHGANVNICLSDGNTAHHELIENIRFYEKSTHRTSTRISNMLLKHGLEYKPNAQGVTPLLLACLEGSETLVLFLLDKLFVNGRQRADCFELLASSILFPTGFSMKKSYEYLHKALMLRRAHNPPLLKSSKHDSLEGRPFRAETQTLEELRAIRTDADEIMIELFLARQRILDDELHNDYLLPPLIRVFISHKMNGYCYRDGKETGAKKHISILLNAFKTQQQLSVHPYTYTLKRRIVRLDMLCELIELKRTVGMSDFSAMLDSIEGFYQCGNSENDYMTKKTYAYLLEFLYRIITKAHMVNDEDIEALTKKFLLLTRGSKEFYVCRSKNGEESAIIFGNNGSWNIPLKLITGDNVLHIVCRDIKGLRRIEDVLEISNKTRKGLAKFLKMLHGCGEDVNAQNSDGQTPLQALVSELSLMRHPSTIMKRSLKYHDFPEAVRSLLLAGANPDLRDKSKATSLHAAMMGYGFLFRVFDESDFNLKEWNSIVELLLKIGADPQARDSRGFSPLHVLMDTVFRDSNQYHLNTWKEDGFAYHRQMFHEVVQTIQSYGGCPHAITNDGRTVKDMCNDEDLKEKMGRSVRVTRAHLTLVGLTAAAIRKHQVQYCDQVPKGLIKIIELRD